MITTGLLIMNIDILLVIPYIILFLSIQGFKDLVLDLLQVTCKRGRHEKKMKKTMKTPVTTYNIDLMRTRKWNLRLYLGGEDIPFRFFWSNKIVV
jgi:hypothetical protein